MATSSGFSEEQLAVLEGVKTGASSSWIMASAAIIFFMQAGFMLVEVAAIRKRHFSAVVLKNLLDTLTGAIGFWAVGFGLAFGKTDSHGFVGTDSDVWFSSARWTEYKSEDLYMKFIFQFAFCNTASAIVSGLVTERLRIEMYALISFLMSFYIYPIVACWVWNPTGWLWIDGFHDFAGCGPVHLTGGLSGLIGCIILGQRINKFNTPQFPWFMRNKRQVSFNRYRDERLQEIKDLQNMEEVKELVASGFMKQDDVELLRRYAIQEFENPNYELEEESATWMGVGTLILWLGWYFFNGGSAYSLYNITLNPSKIITNTILGAAGGGFIAFFVKKPIALFVLKCFQNKNEYYKTFRKSQRFDAGSVCNGVLAGLVAITAPCDVVEPWAALCIGLIGGVIYCLFSKLILANNIDDPLEASSVHYANGVWGLIAVAVFDSQKGLISDSPDKGHYLGVQIYGAIAITAWIILNVGLFFLIVVLFKVAKNHTLIELLGANAFKSGDFTTDFLKKIRESKNKGDLELNPVTNGSARGTYDNVLDTEKTKLVNTNN